MHFKEFEEERNASSIAVNQSMAMITKLQEKNATLDNFGFEIT